MALRAGRVGVAPDQVDGQGKVINAGGGGGGGSKSLFDLLATKNGFTGDYELSNSLENYDLVLISLTYLISTTPVKISITIPVVDLNANDVFGLYGGSAYAYFTYVNDSKITSQNQNVGTVTKTSIYGIKL